MMLRSDPDAYRRRVKEQAVRFTPRPGGGGE